jgi:RNA polymerase sigma-B factor
LTERPDNQHVSDSAPNSDARERLIMSHTGLARAIARRYRDRGVDLDDLVQCGYLGLIQAIDRYDAGRGVPLEAYAARTIEGEILHLLRDRGSSVRLPRPVQELGARLATVEQELTQRLGCPPSVDQLVAETGVDREQVEEALAARSARSTRSLSDGAEPLGLADPDSELLRVDDRDQVARSLQRLEARERLILWLRFGHDLTQAEVAERVGISQMHVSRRERASLALLQDQVA